MAASKEMAAEMLSMLEERLARIEFAVNGTSTAPDANTTAPHPSDSAAVRLRTLERTLKALTARSYAVSDLLQLHSQHPELFHPADSQSAPSTLPPASLAQLVLAHDQSYRKNASQLTTLNENKEIPDPSSLSKLIALQSRIAKLEARQTELAGEFAELRARSARVVEQWYDNGILDMGEKWADWEESLRDCEILVRRREAAKKREDGTL